MCKSVSQRLVAEGFKFFELCPHFNRQLQPSQPLADLFLPLWFICPQGRVAGEHSLDRVFLMRPSDYILHRERQPIGQIICHFILPKFHFNSLSCAVFLAARQKYPSRLITLYLLCAIALFLLRDRIALVKHCMRFGQDVLHRKAKFLHQPADRRRSAVVIDADCRAVVAHPLLPARRHAGFD